MRTGRPPPAGVRWHVREETLLRCCNRLPAAPTASPGHARPAAAAAGAGRAAAAGARGRRCCRSSLLGVLCEPVERDVDVGGALAADAVHAHLAVRHALRPGQVGVFDGGRWGCQPALPAGVRAALSARGRSRALLFPRAPPHHITARVRYRVLACSPSRSMSCCVDSAPGRSFLLPSTRRGMPSREGRSSRACSSWGWGGGSGLSPGAV